MTREEAIEVYNGLINTKIKEAFEFFVPELRKSEDERMLRIIIGGFESWKCNGNVTFNNTNVDDILAYLEKQKEPENVSATTMAPSCWEVEQKEQKPLITGNDFGWIDELKHDLKHPEELDQKVDDVLKQRKGIRILEWSEEDEKMLDEVLDRVTYAFYNQGLDGEIEDDPAFLWLHRLRPSWKPSEEQMCYLKKAYESYDFCDGERDALEALYNDLKKLM